MERRLERPPVETIGDYALIGDGRSAALVSRSGELAWLCLPEFSSPSIFGSLMDPRAGAFAIRAESAGTSRRYRDGSNVLETTFTTDRGSARLIDAMTLPGDAGELVPMREVLRCVEGLRGEVRLRIEIAPRPEYGSVRAVIAQRAPGLWAWEWKGQLLMLRTDAQLTPRDTDLIGEVVVRTGERIWFSLTYAHSQTGVIGGLGDAAAHRLMATDAWWQRWSARAKYDGPHRDAVIRSALVIKLLQCCESGAVVAAPTMSLPEWIGADRNWDYRYCWLRDAALTMRAFTGLGYIEEARRFFDWQLHATRLTWPRLSVLYDIYGRHDIGESELDWQGFRGSRPVRVGNGAVNQLQLDVYGAVCSAARNLVETTGELQRDEARLLKGFARQVCKQWREADNGMWEIDQRRPYTFSRIMCWTALDSLLQLERAGHLKLPSEFASTAPKIRQVVEEEGFNHEFGSYVGTLGGTQPDAALLLGACIGYRDARDERMRGTFDFVHRKLARNGLLMRYEPGYDDKDTPEGAFGICSFFAIDHLAHRGEFERGWKSFEHVLSFANDVGLLSEEIEPDTGELLGNFPQAYTHVGLITAALGLNAGANGAPYSHA